jgi:hypothetical protein
MIKFIYANGCSWTAGNGIESDPMIAASSPDKVENVQRLLSWPQRLAALMNADHVNDGYGGGSNTRMMRRTIEFIRNWPTDQRHELLVVLGWTSIERDEVFVSYRNTRNWCNMNTWQKFSNQWAANSFPSFLKNQLDLYQNIKNQYLTDERECIRKHLQNVYVMANILENLQIKFLFFNSIGGMCFPNSSIDHLKEFPTEFAYLNDARFVDMHENSSMLKFCVDNNIPLSQCHHPMIKGHQTWATYLHQAYLRIYEPVLTTKNEVIQS